MISSLNKICRFSPATMDEMVVRLTPSTGKLDMAFVDIVTCCSPLITPPSPLIDRLIERSKPPSDSSMTEENV